VKKEKGTKLPAKGSESPFQRFERLAKQVVTAPKLKDKTKKPAV